MRETHAITILENKAKRLRKETGNPNITSKLASKLPPSVLFTRSIVRPIKMLIFSPVLLLLSTFIALSYGLLFLLFATLPVVFEGQYNFSSGTSGLVYLGNGVGTLLALMVFRVVSDRTVKKLSAGKEMKPEYRLPIMIYCVPVLPIGFFWYGWSAQAHTHWIMPIIGTAFVGFGIFGTFVSTYSPLQ